jgi:uncharacterized protein (TIGR02679 family)
LRAIPDVRGARARAGIVFVVENPAVFSSLQGAAATLACANGHLSLAALKLLDVLVEGGATLRYSGDFDAGGLTIAQGLLRRYGDQVRLWRMDVASYEAALAPGATRPDPALMQSLRGAFPELVDRILEGGVAYQEALLNLLAKDIHRV